MCILVIASGRLTVDFASSCIGDTESCAFWLKRRPSKQKLRLACLFDIIGPEQIMIHMCGADFSLVCRSLRTSASRQTCQVLIFSACRGSGLQPVCSWNILDRVRCCVSGPWQEVAVAELTAQKGPQSVQDPGVDEEQSDIRIDDVAKELKPDRNVGLNTMIDTLSVFRMQ